MCLETTAAGSAQAAEPGAAAVVVALPISSPWQVGCSLGGAIGTQRCVPHLQVQLLLKDVMDSRP